jgi:hypothetical protein
MIWIGIVFIFVGTIINCNVSDEHPGVYFGTILACVGSMLTAAACYETKPSAMDVYQGKTTLEITYKDNVAVDSIVVFKDKEK